MISVFTKKWEYRSRHPHYQFERHRVWLHKGINVQDIWTEPKSRESTNRDLINILSLASDLPTSSIRKIARDIRFLIFVPDPRSNAAPWNAWTCPANFDFAPQSFKCRGRRINTHWIERPSLIYCPYRRTCTYRVSGSRRSSLKRLW